MFKKISLVFFMVLTLTFARENNEILLATTTSVRDSGLMDHLIPRFEAESGYKISLIAVGTGKALQMGRDGEADVLLVHSKPAEIKFLKEEHGRDRYEVAHNYFVLVGPEEGSLKGKGIIHLFNDIREEKVNFLSRGDDSGTHKKELFLWRKAGITPEGKWYMSSGNGMGATLRIANELRAYTLSDIATFLKLEDSLDMRIFSGREDSLMNLYSVITVNPDKNEYINWEGGAAFARWMVEESTKEIISRFGVEEFGVSLFIPENKKLKEDASF